MILMLVRECLFEHVFLKSQIFSDSGSTHRGDRFVEVRIRHPGYLDSKPRRKRQCQGSLTANAARRSAAFTVGWPRLAALERMLQEWVKGRQLSLQGG